MEDNKQRPVILEYDEDAEDFEPVMPENTLDSQIDEMIETMKTEQ
ncbi:MAG: hypothetical protein WC967_09185 [Balneolaceae bacterium]